VAGLLDLWEALVISESFPLGALVGREEMTASFAAVQASYRAIESLSHRQTVTRL
jgi:hypothetical protein